MPVGVRGGVAAMSQLDKSLDEASLTLGADEFPDDPQGHPAVVAARRSPPRSYIPSCALLPRSAPSSFSSVPSTTWQRPISSGLVENGEYGVAIAYSSTLIIVMVAVIAGFQFLVGERRLRRENRIAIAAPTATASAPRSGENRMINPKAGSVVFHNVRKTFGAFIAIPDLSLTIEPGTLVDAARPLRLRQDDDVAHAGRPRTLHPAGRILIGGKDVIDVPGKRTRRPSMVFQSYALFPHMSASTTSSTASNPPG